MGIPSYFSWLVRHFERKVIKMTAPFNTVHHFYLDLNCAIHPVVKSHPEYSLEKMCDQVVIYLDYLINYVRPTDLVYVAIDGVAPVAKMKQQRMRRYKSVKETIDTNKLKQQFGQTLPEFQWDFNMISPATEFMSILTDKIDIYLKQKRSIKVIFSDASVPSEGEHKILQHIKIQTPTEKNCVIYGLDSDLIMLALCTQRNNIVLIREDNFLKNNHVDLAIDKYPKLNYFLVNELKKILFAVLVTDKAIDGVMSDIPTDLSESLNMTSIYEQLKTSQYDIEKVIRDYIMLSFLLGNDFLPSCLSLIIRDGGIEKVIKAYRTVLMKTQDHYLCCDDLSFNSEFLTQLITILASQEEASLKRQKFSRDKRVTNYIEQTAKDYTSALDQYQKIEHLYKDTVNVCQSGWQKRYYHHFFHTKSDRYLDQICAEYLLALQWNTRYYFDRCPDWYWVYQYEATPLLMDLVQYLQKVPLSHPKIFIHLEPLKPFYQLMMILPPQSVHLLPKAYQPYMISNHSPLIYYYPTDFEIDMYGKKFRWEAHPRIPLIEPDVLPYYLDGLETSLTEEEKKRNTMGQEKKY